MEASVYPEGSENSFWDFGGTFFQTVILGVSLAIPVTSSKENSAGICTYHLCYVQWHFIIFTFCNVTDHSVHHSSSTRPRPVSYVTTNLPPSFPTHLGNLTSCRAGHSLRIHQKRCEQLWKETDLMIFWTFSKICMRYLVILWMKRFRQNEWAYVLTCKGSTMKGEWYSFA